MSLFKGWGGGCGPSIFITLINILLVPFSHSKGKVNLKNMTQKTLIEKIHKLWS